MDSSPPLPFAFSSLFPSPFPLPPPLRPSAFPSLFFPPSPAVHKEKFGGAEQQQLGGQRGDFLLVEREDEGCHEAHADGHTELNRMSRGHESRYIHLHVVSFCVPSVSPSIFFELSKKFTLPLSHFDTFLSLLSFD